MNKKKYRKKEYSVRPVSDLKQLLNTSAGLYGNKAAFLIKNEPGGNYEPVSYARFKKDVEGLGTAMAMMGLQGKRVAVVGENSYWWVVSYFAVTTGIGTVVPIDRELQPKEISGLLKTANVSAVFTGEKLGDKVSEALSMLDNVKKVILMDQRKNKDFEFKNSKGELIEKFEITKLTEEGDRAMEAGMLDYLQAEVDPESLCAVLFSSGTTGMAKGIMLSHRNLVANVINMSKYVEVTTEDVGLSVLPMHHAYEMTCHILTGLYQGLAIAICEGLKHIQKNMVESKTSVMLSVPLIFETIYKKMWKTAISQGKDEKLRTMIEVSKKAKLYNKPKIVKKIFEPLHNSLGGHIRLLIAGGASIDPRVIEDFQAMGFPMIQGYGMTENAPIIAVNKDRYSKASSAGLPMPETEVQVIHKDREGIGEIIVRGPSVMMGYLDNTQATRETIVDGWLHTGDLGYMDKDGFLYVAGRKKNVIVTKNGKNIFPEEVEFALAQSPYIAEVLVHGEEDRKTGDVIVKAEIYPNCDNIKEDKGDLEKEDLKNILKEVIDEVNEEMPLYKRVRRFGIRTKDFEKTTTRKIKRHVESNFRGEE